MVSLLVTLLALVLVASLVLYVIRLIPLPEPFGVVAQALVALIVLIILIDILIGGRWLGFSRGLP